MSSANSVCCLLVVAVGIWSRCLCEPLGGQRNPENREKLQLECKLKDEFHPQYTEPNTVGPVGYRTPKSHRSDQNLNVILEAVEIPKLFVNFQACQFLSRTSSFNCQHLDVVENHNARAFYNLTQRGPSELFLDLPKNLDCQPCLLRYKYTEDVEGAEVENGNSISQTEYHFCGYFTTPRSKRVKRQAEGCNGAGEFVDLPGIDVWCKTNCAVGYCPATHCACSDQAWPADEDYDYGTLQENISPQDNQAQPESDEGEIYVEFLYPT